MFLKRNIVSEIYFQGYIYVCVPKIILYLYNCNILKFVLFRYGNDEPLILIYKNYEKQILLQWYNVHFWKNFVFK